MTTQAITYSHQAAYAVAKLVPPGRVVAYGDIAALFEVNPRLVGRAMSLCDGPDGDPAVPWWRVVNGSGRLPADLLDEAVTHWRAEGTPSRADGLGVRMRLARADLAALGDAAERTLGALPGLA